MVDVAKNLLAIKAQLPEGVELTAVSKFHPDEYITAAYNVGQRIFGESHEQELARKAASLPKDIHWHFIGHLQTNKVKYIAPYISMIESVDSIRLLREIEKQGARCGRRIRVLLDTAHSFFDEVRGKYFADQPSFRYRSWGMSDDYSIAIHHGSNMVRVGTAIFGERVY